MAKSSGQDCALESLARPAAGQPAYLAPHQAEAGQRVRRLFARAHLQPRVTQSFSALPREATRRNGAEEITEMAATARKRLAELHAILPAECAGVVLDVCGFEKGLQQIETERGWPRRSAKLVLRIALDRLAEHYRLSPAATGSETRTLQGWQDEGARPSEAG